jgi:polysaccharide export outer membrane protein
MLKGSQAAVVPAATIVLGMFSIPGFCSQTQPQAAPKPAEVRQSGPAEASEPVVKSGVEMQAAAPVDPKTYKIGPEDVLGVNVWKEREFSGEYVVRPDGKITMPLIGDLTASGLTPEQLQGKVAEALTKYLNQPQVIVSVASVRSKRYYVSGEVNRSGPVALVTPTTVMQALSSAGLREWAKKKSIVVMRGSERLKFNYNDVVKGKKMEQNILLQDGDHIIVP